MTALGKFLNASLTTTAFRLAAFVVAVFVVAAAAVSAFLVSETNRILTEQVLATVRAESALLAAEIKPTGLTAMAAAVAARSRVGSGLYYLAGASGEKLAGNLSRLPPEIAESNTGGIFNYEPNPLDGKKKRLAFAIMTDAGEGARLVIGRDIDDQRDFVSRLWMLLLVSFGLLAGAGLAGGLAVSRGVLKRIETINTTSRSIMGGELSQRIALDGNGGELDDLARNLNAMLDRIENLMNGLREVSDNIAHDLKTPLNRLRNRAEAALRDASGTQGYREGLEHTIEEADDLIKTFNSLLLIARLEAGAFDETVERFDLGGLVRDVGELYAPVAEEAGLKLEIIVSEGPEIMANQQLIGQAVANLIDNAIKYSSKSRDGHPPAMSGHIRIGVTTTADGADLTVSDRGPGIAAEDRERALRRFVRLEKSRTRPGTGLGLSLVAAVARLHGGSVRLEDNDPGLRVVVSLPRHVVAVNET